MQRSRSRLSVPAFVSDFVPVRVPVLALAIFGGLLALSSSSVRAADDDARADWARARANGIQASRALLAAHRTQLGWGEKADPRTGLLPQNLESPLWTPSNSAADLYSYLLLTARFTDPAAFEAKWKPLLGVETLLTSRLGPLPDDYSLERAAFVHPAADLSRIIFGSSEYMKDGLVPITDLLGPGPWFDRMRDIADGIIERMPVTSRFGPLPSELAEVNGNMLQSLSRLWWATADRRYLDTAERIARAYFEEVLPASGGLPVHAWDFTAHAPRIDTLNLNDHGNEVVGGLAEAVLAVAEARPETSGDLRAGLVAMLDRLLEIGRNEDGLWVTLLRPRTGEVLAASTPDTWGYAFTAVAMGHLLTGEERYREAIRKALSNIGKPAYRKWNGADSFADSIEGGILLVDREPVPEAIEWIDAIFPDFLAYQRSDGIVEGWHGDGNFARTCLLYAFWKSQGAWPEPWREDVRVGAVRKGDRLLLSVESTEAWKGRIRLDTPRWRRHWHLPRDYPRLNECPVGWGLEASRIYRVKGIAGLERASGLSLSEGIPVVLEASGSLECAIETEAVEEASGGTVMSAGKRDPFVLGDTPLSIEVETLEGTWRLQTNYPGYSADGFRVSNAAGVASTELRGRVRVERVGEYAVWARGLVSPGGRRAFSVELGSARFPATHAEASETGFRWDRSGTVTLAEGESAIVIRDEDVGYECPDTVWVTPDLAARPDAGGPRIAWPELASDEVLTRANLQVFVELARRGREERRASWADPAKWAEGREALALEVRRALGFEVEPSRTPLAALPPLATQTSLSPRTPVSAVPPLSTRTPLAARTIGTLERDGYRIERVVFESRVGMPVPANLYLPTSDRFPPPRPVVLCPVGHWGLAKAEGVVQARAVGFAKLGLAALVYDPIGQGERAVPGNEHSRAYLAALVGECNMSYMVWDSVRAIDYLETRPEVDTTRLGVTGCSGGGLNTLYLSALEPRLRAAAPVCYVSTFLSILETGIVHCPCSHVPDMGRIADMGQVAALFAPRPMLVIGGMRDPMFTEAGTREAWLELRTVYLGLSVGGATRLFFDDCAHDYSKPMRERAYAFFLEHLAGDVARECVSEPQVDWKPESAETLACFAGGRLPAGTLTYQRSVLEALARARAAPLDPAGLLARKIEAAHPETWKRERLASEPGATLEWEVVMGDDGFRHRVVRTRAWVASVAPAVPAAPVAPAVSRLTVIVLESSGIARSTLQLLEALGAVDGVEALAIDPPLWSEAGDADHLAVTNGLLYGRTPAQLAARVLEGEVSLARSRSRRVAIIARGQAACAVGLLGAIRSGGGGDLIATGAPSSFLSLLDPGTNRPGAIIPESGLAGDIPEYLAHAVRASPPWRVVWSGTPLRAVLPTALDLRASSLSDAEIIERVRGAADR